MTEPIVRHGGIFCEDLQVKTRHSWIHHLHSTRNIGWLCCCWSRQLATPSASQSVVVTDVFPAVSPPYFPIFRGYLHGLWAEWANVGLAICHRLEPMQWTLSVPAAPRDIVLNWPRPAYICQYHHQWSGLLGWDLLLWSTLPHLLSPFLISSILSHWSIQQIPRSEVISRKLPLHSLTVSI